MLHRKKNLLPYSEEASSLLLARNILDNLFLLLIKLRMIFPENSELIEELAGNLDQMAKG